MVKVRWTEDELRRLYVRISSLDDMKLKRHLSQGLDARGTKSQLASALFFVQKTVLSETRHRSYDSIYKGLMMRPRSHLMFLKQFESPEVVRAQEPTTIKVAPRPNLDLDPKFVTRLLLTQANVIEEMRAEHRALQRRVEALVAQVDELERRGVPVGNGVPAPSLGPTAQGRDVSPEQAAAIARSWLIPKDKVDKIPVAIYGLLEDQFSLIRNEYEKWLDLRHVNHQGGGALKNIPSICDHVLIMASFASHSDFNYLRKHSTEKVQLVRGGLTKLRSELDRIRATCITNLGH